MSTVFKISVYTFAVIGALSTATAAFFVLAVAAATVKDARREGRELKRQQEQVAARERLLDAKIAVIVAGLDEELVREFMPPEGGGDR
jgi:hypothetical protein